MHVAKLRLDLSELAQHSTVEVYDPSLKSSDACDSLSLLPVGS